MKSCNECCHYEHAYSTSGMYFHICLSAYTLIETDTNRDIHIPEWCPMKNKKKRSVDNEI